MSGFVVCWVVNAVALYLTTLIVAGVRVPDFSGALAAALILGIVNLVIRPIVLLLTLPANILTLGVFTLVVNTLMLYIVASVTHQLRLESAFAAFMGAVVLSVISTFLTRLVAD